MRSSAEPGHEHDSRQACIGTVTRLLVTGQDE
jgi:hypothetical protein